VGVTVPVPRCDLVEGASTHRGPYHLEAAGAQRGGGIALAQHQLTGVVLDPQGTGVAPLAPQSPGDAVEGEVDGVGVSGTGPAQRAPDVVLVGHGVGEQHGAHQGRQGGDGRLHQLRALLPLLQ
jgi:hypothetical protein